MNYRQLTGQEIRLLEDNSCWAEDWSAISVAEDFKANYFHRVMFYGTIRLGTFEKSVEVSKGFVKHSGINNATLRKLDNTGQLTYTLKSPEIRHYPDDDSTELRLPILIHQSPKKPTITMSADDGHMSSKGEQVDLTGNVRIHRASTGKDAEMVVTAPPLSILPDEEKAYTRHPVLMTQGNSWIKGVGFRMDNRARTYLLEAQARASLESKQQARKKKP